MHVLHLLEINSYNKTIAGFRKFWKGGNSIKSFDYFFFLVCVGHRCHCLLFLIMCSRILELLVLKWDHFFGIHYLCLHETEQYDCSILEVLARCRCWLVDFFIFFMEFEIMLMWGMFIMRYLCEVSIRCLYFTFKIHYCMHYYSQLPYCLSGL